MSSPESRPWPPPPDLPSIQELVRKADPERHFAEGAPEDEYEPEEEAILESLRGLPTSEIVSATILPPIERIWQQSFSLSADAIAERRPKLLALAKEIERFFGPESQPRTRAQILADEAANTPAG